MAITTLELKTVKDAAQLAKYLVQKVKPKLDALNIDYDAAGGVKETLTQGELDSEASFSAITKAQVDDALYALTNVLKTAIDGSYSQLEKLASRAEVTNIPFGNQ